MGHAKFFFQQLAKCSADDCTTAIECHGGRPRHLRERGGVCSLGVGVTLGEFARTRSTNFRKLGGSAKPNSPTAKSRN